jgi:hypothetical protein
MRKWPRIASGVSKTGDADHNSKQNSSVQLVGGCWRWWAISACGWPKSILELRTGAWTRPYLRIAGLRGAYETPLLSGEGDGEDLDGLEAVLRMNRSEYIVHASCRPCQTPCLVCRQLSPALILGCAIATCNHQLLFAHVLVRLY